MADVEHSSQPRSGEDDQIYLGLSVSDKKVLEGLPDINLLDMAHGISKRTNISIVEEHLGIKPIISLKCGIVSNLPVIANTEKSLLSDSHAGKKLK